MPIWSVEFYDERSDFEPSRRGVVRADTQGAAYELVRGEIGSAAWAKLVPAIVRDEASVPEGYRDLAPN